MKKETSKEVINELSKILDATAKKINRFMTPKDKAGDLVKKYAIKLPYDYKGRTDKVSGLKIHEYNIDLAKQLALISVDEIIEFLLQASKYLAFPKQVIYWQEVKQEIEKLTIKL